MATDLTQATINVRANTKAMERDILKSLRTIELSQIDTKKSSLALGRITGQVSEFNKSLEASNARVIAFGASAGAIFAVEKAISSLVTSTIEVEKSLADINVLLSLSSADLQKFSGSLFAVAKNTAQSFSTVAEAATELSRQGLGVEETIKRTNAALILTRLSGLDAKSSVEALTATINSFSSSALDATVIVNKLANVDAAFAVSSADLANAISRVGSTAQDAGVSLDELIALVTSAQQTTARGGSVIGNSFKTIFTRLQRGKVKSLLSELGVDTSESQNAISLLNQLASVYDGLEATQKSAVAESVGGVFQINILKAALGDLGKQYSIYDKALSTSLGSTDQAIQRNKDLNQTVSALANQAYANLQQASSKIGQLVFEPNAKGLLTTVNNLLSSFNEIDVESAGGKFVQGFFKGIGNFIGGPGTVLATAVIAKLFTKLAQFSAGSLKEILGRNEASKQQLVVEQSVLGMLQRNADLNQKILSGKVSVAQAEKGILDLLSAESTVLREQERISSRIAANLMARGVSVRDGKPMVPKAASSGFVPNFASSMALGQAMENAGARDHGYRAGIARKTRIHDGSGKSFTSFVNSKEDVKTFTNAAGKKATIVRPPNGFGENTQYAAGGFIPNFVKFSFNKADDSLAFKRKKIDKISLANFKDQKLLENQNIADAGYDKNGKRNSIFDTITGEVVRKRFIKKERFEKVAQKQFNNYISGNNVSEITKNSFDRGLSKNYPGKNLEEVKKIILSNKEKNKKAFVGDFSNAKGALYESFVSKKIGDKYELSQDEYSRADFFAKSGSGAEYTGIEAKSGSRDLKDILFKAISSSIRNKNQDEKDDLNFGRFALYETFSSGFVPNFAKASDLYKRIKAGEGVTDPFNKEKNKKGVKKDLGSLPYTMIHGGDRGFKKDQFASFSDKEKNIDYQAKMNVAGLNSSKIKNRGIETRVGEALVTETNDLVKIFNPSAKEFSSPKQLANAGSVGSAAGTVFESAVRSAFQNEASGPVSQTSRIDFPNPSEALRGFFYNSPGPYEAKINDSLPNRSSALSKWVAVNNLAGGFLPKGLVFSKSKKDEFGFEGISAKKDGRKVGSIEYFEDLPGVVETGSFSVDKQFRGMGIGRSLYQEMLKRNAGKKITGQLLPQTARFLEKLKRGEKVSAETLYPQIFRAGLSKDSVFEVYGHKGMDVEKMSRQQFTSFVNAKIKELQNDPRKFKQFFGDIDADPGSGLGVKLDTQHSAGFVPNFLDIKRGGLPVGVRGRVNYGSAGSKSNIQLGVGAEPSTLAHELFHSAYSRSTFKKSRSNEQIGKFISEPKRYAGSGFLIGDQIFKNLNKKNLLASVGLTPIQLDFDGKNPGATYSGEKAIDEIITRIQEKIFKNKGNLDALSVDEKTFTQNLQNLGIISGKRLSNISRRSKEGSKFRNLVESKFSSVVGGASSGFLPNFADQIRRNIYDWDGTIIPKISGNAEEYIGKLSSLREKDLLPLGKKLKSGNKKFDIFTARPPIFDKAITDTANRLGLPFNKINFGVKSKDKLVEAQIRKSKLIDDDLGLLGKGRFLNARRLNKRLYSGFVPNFGDALGEAIQREKSAGLSSSQIYVDKHHSLKNKNNPMGLMVANTRDEPRGGVQGIKRAKKEGRNPKTYGASSGFVPNFANESGGDSSGAGFAAALAGLQSLAFTLMFMSQSSRQAKEQISQANKEISSLSKEVELASSSIPVFEKKVQKAQSVIDGKAPKPKAIGALEKTVSSRSNKVSLLSLLRDQAEKSGNVESFVQYDDMLIKAKKELANDQKKLSDKLKRQSSAAARAIAANNQLIQSSKSLVESNQQAIVARKANLKAQKRELLTDRAFAIGSAAQILAPQLASQIDTSTRGGRGTAQGVEAVGSILGLITTGNSVAGPWGAIAGGVAGIAVELPKVIKAFTSIAPDLDKALEKASQQQIKFSETSAVALQAQEQLTSIASDPSSSPEKILQAEQNYINAINSLSAEYKQRLVDAILIGKGQEEQFKIDKELNKKKLSEVLASESGKASEDLSNFSQIASDSASLFLNSFNTSLGYLVDSLTLDRFDLSSRFGSAGVESLENVLDGRVLSEQVAKSIADAVFASIGGEKLNLEGLRPMDRSGLIERIKLQLESDGVLDESEQKSLDFLSKAISRPESFNVFLSQLKLINDNTISREELLQKTRDAQAKKAADEAAKKMQAAMKASQQEAAFLKFNSSIDRTLNNFLRRFDSAVAEMQVVGELQKASANFSEALLGSSYFNRPQQLLDERSANQLKSISAEFSQSNAKNIQGFASGLDESFKNISGAEFKPDPAMKEADVAAARAEFEAEIQKARASLFDERTGIFAPAAVSGLGEEGATEKIISSLDDFVTGLEGRKGFETIAEEIQKFREGAVKQIRDVANSSKEASRERLKQTALLAQTLAFDRAQAKIAQGISFGGQAALEQQLMFDESASFNKLTDSLAALSAGIAGRTLGKDEISSSQAGALVDALKNLREYAGLDSLEELPREFSDSIIQALVKQRKEELRVLESQVKENPSLVPLIDLIKNQLATVGGVEGASLSRVLSELGFKDFDQKNQNLIDQILQDSFSKLPDNLKSALSKDLGLGEAFLTSGIKDQTTILSEKLDDLDQSVLRLPEGLADAVAAAIKNLNKDVADINIDTPKVTSNASSKSIEKAYGAGLHKAYRKEKKDASSLLGMSPSSVQASHGYDRNLVSDSNPLGLGVFSPSLGQSSLKDALLDHKGENLKKPKVGTVPNFYSSRRAKNPAQESSEYTFGTFLKETMQEVLGITKRRRDAETEADNINEMDVRRFRAEKKREWENAVKAAWKNGRLVEGAQINNREGDWKGVRYLPPYPGYKPPGKSYRNYDAPGMPFVSEWDDAGLDWNAVINEENKEVLASKVIAPSSQDSYLTGYEASKQVPETYNVPEVAGDSNRAKPKVSVENPKREFQLYKSGAVRMGSSIYGPESGLNLNNIEAFAEATKNLRGKDLANWLKNNAVTLQDEALPKIKILPGGGAEIGDAVYGPGTGVDAKNASQFARAKRYLAGKDLEEWKEKNGIKLKKKYDLGNGLKVESDTHARYLDTKAAIDAAEKNKSGGAVDATKTPAVVKPAKPKTPKAKIPSRDPAESVTFKFANGGTITVPSVDAKRAQAFVNNVDERTNYDDARNSLSKELSELDKKYRYKPGAPRSYYTRVSEIQTALRNLPPSPEKKYTAANNVAGETKEAEIARLQAWKNRVDEQVKNLDAKFKSGRGEQKDSDALLLAVKTSGSVQEMIDRLTGEKTKNPYMFEYDGSQIAAPVQNYASFNSGETSALNLAYQKEASDVSRLLGKPASSISVDHGFDSRLASSSNPSGVGVFSPSAGQSSLRDAMMDHQKPTRNLAVPNFAPGSTIDSEKLDNLNNSISQLINSISSLSDNAGGERASAGGSASVNIPISVSVSSNGEGSMPQEYYDSLKSEVESTVSRVNAMYADLIKSRSITPIAPSRVQTTPTTALGIRG